MKSAREMVWQTSNMEYGRFYALTTEEEQRRLAGEREGRCEVLTKTLINCQKQLGIMRLRDTSAEAEFSDGFDPPTASYFQAHLERMKKENRPSLTRLAPQKYSDLYPKEDANLKSTSQATSRSTMLPSSSDQSTRLVPSKSSSSEQALQEEHRKPNNYVGRVDPTGIEEDTKQLEWILNRLADKLQPLTNGGLPVLKFTPSDPKPVQRMRERRILRSKPNKHVQCKLPKCQHPAINCKSTGGSRLPPYCRYGFYRYYGYAGQGAKTSWGHNLPLGQKPPYGKRTKGLFKY